MTKLLKCVMFTRLYDKFPYIKDISKDGFPIQLIIHVDAQFVDKKSGETYYSYFHVRIDSANPDDRDEPYTQETLEKAYLEYPKKYQEQLDFLYR